MVRRYSDRVVKKIKRCSRPKLLGVDKIGNKSGLYDKARNSSTRQWVDSLTGWKWWLYQIGGGLLFFIMVELLLNLIGMTILPWR